MKQRLRQCKYTYLLNIYETNRSNPEQLSNRLAWVTTDEVSGVGKVWIRRSQIKKPLRLAAGGF
jgi:hypothetical protein